jgi:hypothetical protein
MFNDSLSRANSRSSILTPGFSSLTIYEKSLHKYPWLTGNRIGEDVESGGFLRHAAPLASLTETGYADCQRWNYGQIPTEADVERGSYENSAVDEAEASQPASDLVSGFIRNQHIFLPVLTRDI